MTRALSILALGLATLPARADDLRIPPGLLLCGTAAEIASTDHAGCWKAAGGQRIERVNAAVTWSQLVIRTTDDSETAIVYARRVDADRLQAEAAQ